MDMDSGVGKPFALFDVYASDLSESQAANGRPDPVSFPIGVAAYAAVFGGMPGHKGFS